MYLREQEKGLLSSQETSFRKRDRQAKVEVDPELIKTVLKSEIKDMESIVKDQIQPNGDLSPEAGKMLKEYLQRHPEMVEDDAEAEDDQPSVRALLGPCEAGKRHRCIYMHYCCCIPLRVCPTNTWFSPGGKYWHCTCPAGTKKVFSWFNARADCL